MSDLRHDLQYKVMRNSETLASYREWSRAAWAKWRMLLIIAMLSLIVGAVIFCGGVINHSLFLSKVGPVFLIIGGSSQILAVGLVAREKRLHPWKPT
jgi:uncharacterized membrane protein YgdD (TMEM256/DUF423 family)